MVIVALLGTIAWGGSPGEPATGGIVVTNGELTVDVTFGAPPKAAGPVRSLGRTCPVEVRVSDGAVRIAALDSCHPYAQVPVSAAIETWIVRTTGTVGSDRLLAELLYVFEPNEAEADAKVWVVPQATSRIVVSDRDVLLAPFSIVAAQFPVWPRDARDHDVVRGDCEVRIRVDEYGAPEQVDVSRCDEVFVESTAAAFRRWSFGAWKEPMAPYRVMQFLVRYVRKPGDDGLHESAIVFEPEPVRADYPPQRAVLEEAGPDYVPAQPRRRTVPKVPAALRATLSERTVCRLLVKVDERGKPAEVETGECPASFVELSTKTVAKWRWTPASREGRSVASTTAVALRFDPLR